MIRSVLLAATVCALGVSGCVSLQATAQEAAQPTLPTSPLTVVSADTQHGFTVEVASSQEEIATGMMFRTEMADDAGMLFDLGVTRRVSFFMKNTLIPLDMLFMDESGLVLAIAENAEPQSLRLIDPGVEVRAVLEINGGRAEALGIAPGDQVEHEIFVAQDGQ